MTELLNTIVLISSITFMYTFAIASSHLLKKVIELDPNSITKELNDVTQVEKYTISEEEYKNRPSTLNNFSLLTSCQ